MFQKKALGFLITVISILSSIDCRAEQPALNNEECQVIALRFKHPCYCGCGIYAPYGYCGRWRYYPYPPCPYGPYPFRCPPPPLWIW